MLLALPLYDDTPRRAIPLGTVALVGVCIAVFLWQESLPPRASQAAIYAYGMVPAVLFGHAHLSESLRTVPAWATIFTSMFMHGGWLHIIGNMIYLWIFGRGVEDALGPLRFLVFYFTCGVAAALTQALVDPSSTVPMIGASGAIAGTLGAYMLLNPRGNVVVLFWFIIIVRLIAVPAIFLLGLWFALQLMSALETAASEPGVATWAHVGGFITGLVLVPFFKQPNVPLFRAGRSRPYTLAPWQRRQRGPWG